jgi:hypothetical protein
MNTQDHPSPREQRLGWPDGGPSFSNDRHRILREVIEALRRHPVVTDVSGYPPSTFTEVRATLAPNRWRHETETATLRVTWQPVEPPEFAFHYSEDEFDCGWHREPNPHVDGDAHYQQRTGENGYRYESISFEGETASELVWEVMERLKQRLLDSA